MSKSMRIFMSAICVLLLANVVALAAVIHVSRWEYQPVLDGRFILVVDKLKNTHYIMSHKDDAKTNDVVLKFMDYEFEEIGRDFNKDPRN